MPKLNPYFPGIVLFITMLVIGMATYQDYGMAWDEPGQRYTGLLNYNYVFEGNQELFKEATDFHGASFEMVLLIIEKKFHITDSRDIYLMRHIASHIFFLIAVFIGYVLFYRLFQSRFIASLGFLMLALAPRIYAHSFFNSKDVPFLAMIIIICTLFHNAFKKNKRLLFVALGLACGYTTGIRVMGIMFVVFILFFLLIDIITNAIKKINPTRPVVNAVLFLIAFCVSLCLSWPFLWRAPVHHFVESYKVMSHYFWGGVVLFNGKYHMGGDLPWTYLLTWFLISNPVLWLVAGIAGILLLFVKFVKNPLAFIANTPDRNYTFYGLCFFVPIAVVLIFHSVIYDDWRHLYFVYPPFVLMALYVINIGYKSKYKRIVQSLCAIQVALVGFIMVKDHPFEQVYFNELVTYKEGYIRNNYELEYWGCGFQQGLEHLVAKYPSDSITVSANSSGWIPLENNIMMLPASDRGRVQIRPREQADYYLTNFRFSLNENFYTNVEYAVERHNTTILCVYKTH